MRSTDAVKGLVRAQVAEQAAKKRGQGSTPWRTWNPRRGQKGKAAPVTSWWLCDPGEFYATAKAKAIERDQKVTATGLGGFPEEMR